MFGIQSSLRLLERDRASDQRRFQRWATRISFPCNNAECRARMAKFPQQLAALEHFRKMLAHYGGN
jgi:hypothetical protein